MVKQAKEIDVTNMPEVLGIAEEVESTDEPLILRRGSKPVAIVMPMPREQALKGKPMTANDPLMKLVGFIDTGPGDVARNKHKYLADAYEHKVE